MKFQKYHGLGNDFIILNAKEVETTNYSELAIKVCDRKTGIGADGLIVISFDGEIPRMNFFNCDGTTDTMCGNGIRCMAYYLKRNKLILEDNFEINTSAGTLIMETTMIDGKFWVKVNMGKPNFSPDSIPAISENEIVNRTLEIEGKSYLFTSLFMGTAHTVVFVNKVSDKLAEKLGPIFNDTALFPEETNVNFVEIISKNHIKIKTFERGVGLTLACGTGSCASVIVGNRFELLEKEVTVSHFLGDLKIGIKDDIFMTGPSVFIALGEYDV